jgi:hypothetical protein
MNDLGRKISSFGQWLRSDRQQSQINARFTILAQQVADHILEGRGAPVVFFNASCRLVGVSLNAAFSLLTSWSLRLEGVRVVHFVCGEGMSRCVQGTNRDNPRQPPPCRRCMAQSRALFAGADARYFDFQPDTTLRLKLRDLTVKEMSIFEYGGLALGALALPSLRWVLRRHHLQDDEDTRALYRWYILSAWNVAQKFAALLDKEKPQAVVVFNGMFFPEAVARVVALRRGIRVIAHEVGIQPGSAFFTTGEATAYPMVIPDDFELSREQNQRLDVYLADRRKGNFNMAGVRFWKEMNSLDEKFIQKMAEFKQVVPIFTNVIFDTSQGHANVVFPHMFAWLDMVLRIIQAHPETFFVLRAHPDEGRPGKESRESVAQWAALNRVHTLRNLRFVDSGEFLSSYELIQRSKFVMVYNSTIGLEAALMGTPVLCAGKARFTQLPMVFFPHTQYAFQEKAKEMLTTENITVPPEFVHNARRFFYYQLFRTSLPFGNFVEEAGGFQGFVRLKAESWQEFDPRQSETLRIISDGIIHDQPFLLEQ